MHEYVNSLEKEERERRAAERGELWDCQRIEFVQDQPEMKGVDFEPKKRISI